MNKQFTKIFVSLSLAIISLSLAQQEITTVAELERLAPLGGEYRLAAGTYELTEPLLLTKGLTLLGAGIGETIVSGSSPLYVISIESSEHFKLDGISFKYTGTEGSELVQIEDASFEISNSSFSGAKFAETEDFWYGDGLWIHGNAKGTVSNSIFENNELEAIGLEGNANLTVSNSQMTNNGSFENGSTIAATNETELFLENNILTNNFNGSYFAGNAKVTAIGNTITNSGDGSAAITAVDNADLGFQMNTISNNPLGAFSLFDSASLLVNFSEISQNGASAIYAQDESLIKLHHNAISDSLGTSIFVLNNARLEGISNTIRNSGNEDTAIVAQDQAEIILLKTKLINNPHGALSLFDSAQGFLEKTQIVNNGSNSYAAIYAEADTNLYLNDNELLDNISGALFIVGNAKLEASGNTIKDSGLEQKAILAKDNARVNFDNNIISDNSLGAVWLYGSAKASFENNDFSNNGNADYDSFFIEDQAEIIINNNDFVNNYGFAFNENSRAVISKNTIIASQQDDVAAISVYDDSIVEIIKNEISNGLDWAVFANGNTDLVLLQNLIQNNYGGLRIGGNAKVRILVNNISNNNNRGINLFDNANAYLAANVVLGNAKSGLVVRDSARAQVYKNSLLENSGTGLGVIENARAIVLANEMLDNTVQAVAAGDDTWLMLISNEIANSPRGVLFLGKATGIIKDNQISNTDTGILLRDNVKPVIEGNVFESVDSEIINE